MAVQFHTNFKRAKHVKEPCHQIYSYLNKCRCLQLNEDTKTVSTALCCLCHIILYTYISAQKRICSIFHCSHYDYHEHFEKIHTQFGIRCSLSIPIIPSLFSLPYSFHPLKRTFRRFRHFCWIHITYCTINIFIHLYFTTDHIVDTNAPMIMIINKYTNERHQRERERRWTPTKCY